MSLDVSLKGVNPLGINAGPQIFIREDGATKRISREEWDQRNPGIEPVTFQSNGNELFTANITHNLTAMADAAGIYEALWRPENIKATKARDLIDPLTKGIKLLRSDPERFKSHNPSNGWGTYEGLLAFAESYCLACSAFPSADIEVSR